MMEAYRIAKHGIQTALLSPAPTVALPGGGTPVTLLIGQVGTVLLGACSLVDANILAIGAAASFPQGIASSTVEIQGTADPSTANNMQILAEMGLQDLDIAGNGTVLTTLVAESQIVGGVNSDLFKFVVTSYFALSLAPAGYRIRIRGLTTGGAIDFLLTLLRGSWEHGP